MAPGAKWFAVIDPITYAYKAVIPAHFYCAGGATAGCPTISVPSSMGTIIVDRYTYVSQKFELSYDDRWNNLGYLAVFVAAFFGLAIVATWRCRHIRR